MVTLCKATKGNETEEVTDVKNYCEYEVKYYTMAARGEIKWPDTGVPNDDVVIDQLNIYAESSGIVLNNFYGSDADIELMREAIDDLEIIIAKYPQLKQIGDLGFSYKSGTFITGWH